MRLVIGPRGGEDTTFSPNVIRSQSGHTPRYSRLKL